MTRNPDRRVVITGLGVVTNVGVEVETMWSSLLAGRSGISPITAFDQDGRWAVRIAGQAADWNPADRLDVRELKRMDRFSALAMSAALDAADDCGITLTGGDPYRRGVVIGSGIGGIDTIEVGLRRLVKEGPKRIGPFTVPKLMANAASGNVSIRLDLRGANSATTTACASGGHAIGNAGDLIRRDEVDVMFAGGAEAAITPLCISSFAAMKALSSRNHEPELASRPFDRDRDGFVLAEGAAVLVLEALEHANARGAKIYAELVGFGSSGDAHHIAAPEPSGMGAVKAMEAALRQGEIDLDDVDYINAHGTSTPLGDTTEVRAVTRLFGSHASKLCISSTKSMTGHALGAAGGIESVITVLSVQNDVVPPTINLDHPDDDFNLDFVAHTAQERPVRVAMNNSFGFGGHNVSLAFRKFE